MNQPKKVVSIKNPHEGQILYLGRWVDKEHFSAFVYNSKGEERLASSYKEFEDLTTSGVWFASKDDASKNRKQKHDSTSPISK